MPVADADAYRGLRVCRRSGELRGAPVAWPERVHECACDRNRRKAEGLACSQRWSGFDYNRMVELCRCCAAEVLTSGSRWSVWFCGPCKQQVRDLNARVGFYAIPIGRHSMMGDVALAGAAAQDPAEVQRFVQAAGGIFAAVTRLEEWMPGIVADNCTRSGLPGASGEIELAAYRAAVDRAGPAKDAAFRRLCDFWVVLSDAGRGAGL